MAIVVDETLDLRAALQAVDPSVLLLPPRTLRRLIKYHGQLPVLGLNVPHRKSYGLSAADFDRLLNPEEKQAVLEANGIPSSESFILLPLPTPAALTALSRPQILRKYWRLLFHARIHRELESKLKTGELTTPMIRQRWHEIGPTATDEIKAVLKQDRFILAPLTPESLYIEFAAVYLELRYFRPELLPDYFPGLEDRDRVAALLSRDFDAEALRFATKPAGAAEVDQAAHHDHATAQPTATPTATGSSIDLQAITAKAQQASQTGNVVRGAILFTHAATGLADTARQSCLDRAADYLGQLCDRLQVALDLTDQEKQDWLLALPELLDRAADGFWNREARLLYDLQKICVDHEKRFYAIDLVPWFLSLGRRPLKRLLKGQRETQIVKHLRSAAKRVEYVRLDLEPRLRLEKLLHHSLVQAEGRLRDHFRPLLLSGLEDVGLWPSSFPERLARDKLVEELLDRLTTDGFFNIGHLRDAVSRNQLKLPDLEKTERIFHTEPLLRLNRQYAESLAGIYRPGEIYMRVLQVVSALTFGTPVGRWLMWYLILPFGGGFVGLKALEYVLHLVGWDARFDPDDGLTILGLGLVIGSLLHLSPVRRGLWRVVRTAGQMLRLVFYEAPAWLIGHPGIRAFFSRGLGRYVLLPLTPALPAGLVVLRWADDPSLAIQTGVAVILLMTLLFNTRLGTELIEVVLDVVVARWQWFFGGFLPGFLRLLMELFRLILDRLERLLYTVDEWLRFRSGDSTTSLILKALLGQFWGIVKYIARIYINLLVEPTVNPIKHFPVVTVGHKMIVPTYYILYKILMVLFFPFGMVLGSLLAGVTIFFIPGIFGFIVWELKENWKLYAANRPRDLKRVMVGSHGETVLRLLRPGFHSGTVPKLLNKLRKAARRGNDAAVHKLHHQLDHVAEAVHRFIEREFLWFLRESRGWGGLPIEMSRIDLATNRLRVSLGVSGSGDKPIALAIDLRGRWLVASIADAGWLKMLTPEQRLVFRTALAGLYKKAGIYLIREQIAGELGVHDVRFDVTSSNLVVWPDQEMAHEVIYDLAEEPTLRPMPPEIAPALEADRLWFDRVPVSWEAWVQAWTDEESGGEATGAFLPGVRLLPPD